MQDTKQTQFNINRSHLPYIITGATFTVVVALFLLNFLHIFSIDNSYAETATSSASAEMSVNLDPTITIWTTDTSDNPITAANIAASPDESVATTAVRAHVSTNNLTGYTLTIQSNSTDAKMKHENTSVTKTIDPITGSGTSSSAWAGNPSLNNMWGYSIGTNDSFVGVPGSSSSATTIDSTDAPNNDNYTDITFATKADLSLPAGTYTDTVIFSAVANAVPTPIVDGMNMQDVTQQMCTDTPLYSESGTTYTLTDARDNSTYQVRKLADGNCWMVSNLKLTGARTLTSADSNVSSDFTLKASDSGTWCTTSSSDCDDQSMMIDAHTSTYPESYLYNWYAATAGTGKYATSSGNASSSICPKSGSGSTSDVSWHLPSGGAAPSGSATGSEWYEVFKKGGITYLNWDGTNTPFADKLGANSPFNLSLSGYRDGSRTSGRGTDGNWWSSTASDNGGAYDTYAYSDGSLGAGPDDYGKYYGYSVRCVLSSE